MDERTKEAIRESPAFAAMVLASVIAPAPGWRPWTRDELEILDREFPVAGLDRCVELLPGRTISAIAQRAMQRKLRNPHCRWWRSTPEMDEAIRRVYQGEVDAGPRAIGVKALAAEMRIPRHVLFRRARQLGFVVPRFKEPAWSEAEIKLLAQHAHQSPERIAQVFRGNGFRRSVTSVNLKRKRLDLIGGNGEYVTASAAAKLFGFGCAKTVTAWIAAGRLPADRRGTARKECQGGDHHWIRLRDLRRFVIENPEAIDLRKVDKLWFIDFLAGAVR